MSSRAVTSEHQTESGVNVGNYAVGYGLSVILTLIAFWLVAGHIVSGQAALLAICGLALLQFTVQVLCFLHLGGEMKPRNKLTVFLFMLVVVFILVAGSVWIMNNLNYRMHNPAAEEHYLQQNEDL